VVKSGYLAPPFEMFGGYNGCANQPYIGCFGCNGKLIEGRHEALMLVEPFCRPAGCLTLRAPASTGDRRRPVTTLVLIPQIDELFTA
jgi:hypothetical protein